MKINHELSIKIFAMILIITKLSEKKRTYVNNAYLNNILFFSDLVYYLEKGKTISGVKYKKSDYGPAPVNIRKIMSDMIYLDFLKEESKHNFGYPEFLYIVSDSVMIKNVEQELEYNELDKITLISDKLGCFSALELSDRAHISEPWKSSSWFDKLEFERAKSDTKLIAWMKKKDVLICQ